MAGGAGGGAAVDVEADVARLAPDNWSEELERGRLS
jgi:hypothetical protein